MNGMNSINCLHKIEAPVVGGGLVRQADCTGDKPEYKSIEGLPERLWVHVTPTQKPLFFAVRDKLVEELEAPIQGFALLQLRLSGVCIAVVATVPGADKVGALESLKDIPVGHLFALSTEGVEYTPVPCPSNVPASAWLCFALPRVMV